MRVIFVDFDGVLNSYDALESVPIPPYHGCLDIHPLHVRMLNQLCGLSGAGIVVSSIWRILHVDEIPQRLIEKGMDPAVPVLGCTPRLPHLTRGDEILAWLDQHPDVTSFVILDDDNDFKAINHVSRHWIQTTMQEGLQAEHVRLALEKFHKQEPFEAWGTA